MANIPKITIIIPVFNEISTIEKVIERILQQKRIKKKQLIIVDDFSSDGTRELLKKIKLKSLKIIYKYKNEGKGSAIKIAQKLVSGNIVIIQDADLEYHPKDYIKLIKPIIQKKNKCSLRI
jgi:glycosyltransferase involved in cell wall biosynthesis